MSRFCKFWKHLGEFDWKNSCCFGPGYVRCLLLAGIVLLLLYSLVFHNFIIILAILIQILALIGTFF